MYYWLSIYAYPRLQDLPINLPILTRLSVTTFFFRLSFSLSPVLSHNGIISVWLSP